MITRPAVHQALKAWHNTRRLGELPLAQIPLIEAHRQEHGYQPTPTGRGLALREIIQRALDTLKPDGDPDPLEKRWRPYLLLTERYLNGRSPDYLIEILGIARSTFDHTQTDALESLSDLLRQWAHAPTPSPSPLFSLSPLPLPPTPFLAPPRPSYALIGRDPFFQQFKTSLLNGGHTLALYGLPGVGKTALTVALTHDSDLRSRYPDGVLWAGLGNHPNLLALLGIWGTALGLTADELSKLPNLDTRARAIHAAIGLRQMLLVIDDAWASADALTFNLGGPHCATVLTTRLPKVALDFAGDHTHLLPELSDEDGLALLAEFAPHILPAEPDAARALVHAAGGLPLAITLMGRHLRQETHTGPPRRLRTALERLQTTETRLRLTQPASPLDHQPSLSAEVPLSLLTVIAISTETLPEETRRAFNALSIFPPKPNTFSEEAALTVCSAVTPAPLIALDSLVDGGLVEYLPSDRYTLHPILAEFAHLELAETLTLAATVAEHFTHFFLRTLPDDLEPDAENLLAALTLADTLPLPDDLIRGANAFCPYLETRGLYTLAEHHLTRAEAVARQSPDSEPLLATLNNLGRIAQRQGNYPRAEACYREALALTDGGVVSSLRSAILQGLGLVALSRGEFAQAGEYLNESLVVARAEGNATVVSAVLSNLGALHFNRGEYDRAGELFQEGLVEARKASLQQQTNALLTNLGVLSARRGDLGQAQAFFEEALELARQLGQRSHTSYLLTNLGTLASERGEQATAVAYFQEGLKLAREMGQRDRVGHLLANLGALATKEKDYARAEEYLTESLSLSREIGHRQNLILALTNLSGLRMSRETYSEALPFLEEAMALAREIGQVGYISSIELEFGRFYLGLANYEDAEKAYEEGLALARQLGTLAGVGRALFGLARVAFARGEKGRAVELAQESVETYQKIGHYRENIVRVWVKEAGLEMGQGVENVSPPHLVDDF
ncbi:MAG: tetratricopeptide repeat protein [Anaerolineales bacterium]|nr:tetratricopeptide repeat protein [Anaerolineales bacterium]